MVRISYNKLWKMLIDKEMQKRDLQELAGISSASIPSDDLVIKSVEEKVDELQTILESQCEENDRATTLLSDIDSLIYQIYGLNKSEVTVIEEHQS